MTNVIEGGCRCGQLRYLLQLERLPKVYACHCLDCQTSSGSAFSLHFFLPEDRLALTGQTMLYEEERLCPTCFVRIFAPLGAMPGLLMMFAGTLDRSNELEVVAHVWAKRKAAGIEIPPGTPMWPEHPPVAEFISQMTA
ncbi:GFA family protein [Labrys okinawensis]|uniref:GFA family protein n=1 Tax=Labrys okinawensis TaxID=346911 RepID=UPI0039BD4D86